MSKTLEEKTVPVAEVKKILKFGDELYGNMFKLLVDSRGHIDPEVYQKVKTAFGEFRARRQQFTEGPLESPESIEKLRILSTMADSENSENEDSQEKVQAHCKTCKQPSRKMIKKSRADRYNCRKCKKEQKLINKKK